MELQHQGAEEGHNARFKAQQVVGGTAGTWKGAEHTSPRLRLCCKQGRGGRVQEKQGIRQPWSHLMMQPADIPNAWGGQARREVDKPDACNIPCAAPASDSQNSGLISRH